MEQFEQAIFEALQTKYAGVDAKILGRIAKKKAKTAATEADAKTIADGITLQQIIDSHADWRATEASKTAVENYESAHKLKDGKPAEQPKPETKPEAKPEPDPEEWDKSRTRISKSQRGLVWDK